MDLGFSGMGNLGGSMGGMGMGMGGGMMGGMQGYGGMGGGMGMGGPGLGTHGMGMGSAQPGMMGGMAPPPAEPAAMMMGGMNSFLNARWGMAGGCVRLCAPCRGGAYAPVCVVVCACACALACVRAQGCERACEREGEGKRREEGETGKGREREMHRPHGADTNTCHRSCLALIATLHAPVQP